MEEGVVDIEHEHQALLLAEKSEVFFFLLSRDLLGELEAMTNSCVVLVLLGSVAAHSERVRRAYSFPQLTHIPPKRVSWGQFSSF